MGILGMAIIVLLITVPISEAQSLMEDRVQDILARSGSLERLRQFPIYILAGLRQARNLVEQRYQTKLMERMMASYDESHVEHMLVHAMAARLDEKTLDAVIAWYDGPTGQKIAALEATQSFHRLDDEEFTDDQIAKPFASRRLEQVRRLESALDVQAVREEFAISTALALTAALNALLSSDQQIDPRLMREELEAEHRRERMATRQQTIDSLWTLYQGLTDQELEHYVAFVESAHGQRFYRALRTSLRHVLTRTSRELGRTLGQALREIERLQGV